MIRSRFAPPGTIRARRLFAECLRFCAPINIRAAVGDGDFDVHLRKADPRRLRSHHEVAGEYPLARGADHVAVHARNAAPGPWTPHAWHPFALLGSSLALPEHPGIPGGWPVYMSSLCSIIFTR